jgi:carboxypeptidase Q
MTGLIRLFSLAVLLGAPAAASDEPADLKPQAGELAAHYAEVATRIREAGLKSDDGYRKLEQLCDDIGHRIAGSENYRKAAEWAAETLRRDGHENVRLEPVTVPYWERGKESCTMTEPRRQPLAMLGLGFSPGTPAGGITAQVVVVRDEQEFTAKSADLRGKIVLFNNPMPPYTPQRGTSYGETVRFRGKGPHMAAEAGAVACLVRSVTATTLRSPHTGMTRYGKDAGARVPAAAISVEDAESIARLSARNIPVTVTLEMEAAERGDANAPNVIAELRGTSEPDQIVIISGHLDSWDVGQGAHDDGAGCAMAMGALKLIRSLDLHPRRTIRVVLWAAEEIGSYGAKTYLKEHAAELPRHVAAIEADLGGFAPIGYGVDAEDSEKENRAGDQLRDLLALLAPLGADRLRMGDSAADVGVLMPAGVVCLGHNTDPARYFDFHHSHADTFDKVDRNEFARNVAAMATVAYILADMPTPLGALPAK